RLRSHEPAVRRECARASPGRWGDGGRDATLSRQRRSVSCGGSSARHGAVARLLSRIQSRTACIETDSAGVAVVRVVRPRLHGVGYEFDGGNLPQLVKEAFDRVEWSRRSSAGERYLSFLASHCLYGYAGAPLRRGAQDFAAFLSRFHAAGCGDPASRLEQFVE